MKRMLILIVAAMPLVGASAQSQRETVYLHNGSVIKGEVIEAVPGESIKVKTADGSIFVYDMADVERIAKEQEADGYVAGNSRGGHRGLDFTVDVGYGISTQGGSGIITTGIGLGKRFTKNFYFGLGTGAYVSPDGGNPLVPVTADFKALFPVGRTRIAPGGLFKLGYVFNTEGSVSVPYLTGRNNIRYRSADLPNYFMIQIMPTVEIPLSQKVDFNVGLGYTQYIPVGGDIDIDGSGMFTVKAGFGFHKGAVPKPKKPILDRGFQWGIEGGILNVPDFNAAFVLSYKWNKNLSFGLGFGAESNKVDYDDESRHGLLTFTDSRGQLRESLVWTENDLYLYKFFARGTWRFLDYRISPIVSCDLGVKWMANYNYYNLGLGVYEVGDELAELTDDYSYSGFYFTPSVGVSLRTTNNFYLEAKVGYSCTAAIKEKSETVNSIYDGYETDFDVSLPKRKMSSLFFSIGFTHTFRLGSNWGK